MNPLERFSAMIDYMFGQDAVTQENVANTKREIDHLYDDAKQELKEEKEAQETRHHEESEELDKCFFNRDDQFHQKKERYEKELERKKARDNQAQSDFDQKLAFEQRLHRGEMERAYADLERKRSLSLPPDEFPLPESFSEIPSSSNGGFGSDFGKDFGKDFGRKED